MSPPPRLPSGFSSSAMHLYHTNNVYDAVYATSPRGTLLSPLSPTAKRAPPSAAISPRTETKWTWKTTQLGLSPVDTRRAFGSPRDIQPAAVREVTSDDVPPKPPSKPFSHTHVKPHGAHFVSWPGNCAYVKPSGYSYFKPQTTSPFEGRGDLPIMPKMFWSPGGRPPLPNVPPPVAR